MAFIPKDEEFLAGDNGLKNLIRILENYIEIDFEMLEVSQAIEALSSSFAMKKTPKIQIEDSPFEDLEFLKEIQPLLDSYEKNKNPFQAMRDDIWKYKDEFGTNTVLMLLNPRLLSSLEQLLAGAIVKYTKAFNESQRRTSLNPKKIFKDQKELLDFHNEIVNLRNKHFAHTELALGKHVLKYFISESEGEIELITDSHTTQELSPTFNYSKFYKLVSFVRSFLSTDIKSKSLTIKRKLTQEQKEALRKNMSSQSV
ncbi:hypothetical protein [Vibrio sp. THAF190c]|uniref:hypothetical protein n=1 Tax=Vibrio sp. THAF190c TaxID=2587865 RepID=UPI00126911B0|nr:hypothetical protein [Vibrio sp. THAF190c]QFT12985.1 hypothetical protein FIV04_23880 [Vibrio sp. THAF190c]